MVLKCMKCSVSAMWMWWSCNVNVFTIFVQLLVKNGIEMYTTCCNGIYMLNGVMVVL